MQPKLKLKTSQVARAATRKQRDLNNIASKAHDKFVNETPIRTGNARRRTRLKGETIEANYPYAHRLDEGYSKQARQGMSEPTIKYIRAMLRRILGN